MEWNGILIQFLFPYLFKNLIHKNYNFFIIKKKKKPIFQQYHISIKIDLNVRKM